MKLSPSTNIQEAVRVLAEGGVLIHPTDTIPGLACDATNPTAIDRLYKIKERDPQKPLLMLCSDWEMVQYYVNNIPASVQQLQEDFAHIPMTIIYSEPQNLPKNLLAPNGSIGIRIPNHSSSLSLIRQLGKPLASTSANRSGEASSQTVSNIDPAVLNLVDYVLFLPAEEARTSTKASWVIRPKDGRFEVLRRGMADIDFENRIAQ